MKASSIIAVIMTAGFVAMVVVVVVLLVKRGDEDTAQQMRDLDRSINESKQEQSKRTFVCYSTCLTCDVKCSGVGSAETQKECSSECYANSAACCTKVGATAASRGCGCDDGESPSLGAGASDSKKSGTKAKTDCFLNCKSDCPSAGPPRRGMSADALAKYQAGEAERERCEAVCERTQKACEAAP